MRQPTLFGGTESVELKIDYAAQQAGVSNATIRNWIKTGYLKQADKGSICAESFNRFLKEVVGTDKLNCRANKLYKDSHDHKELSDKFLETINKQKYLIDDLGEKYEISLSNSYRNKEGIYYTPHSIVIDLFQSPFSDLSSKTFCDPCCGSGNFIMRALDLGFKPEHIYGYDIDPVAVAITKSRIAKRTGFSSKNIKEADFLSITATGKIRHFDCIYTNPPWGKKLQQNEKRFYGKILQAGKSVDTCSLFFLACLKSLANNGKLGLLLPEAFFNISTFETVRLKTLELSIERLTDYGKCFKGLITKAQSIVLENNVKKENSSPRDILCEVNGNHFFRPKASFKKNPKSILNFHCNNIEANVIEHIFDLPHITLRDNAKWGLGIVTGNNQKFCRKSPFEGYMPVYKGSDISLAGLKESDCFIPKDLSLYQQVAPTDMFEAEEKLIYKFISSKLCFFYDTQKRYILNSANILIPKSNFPVNCEQLCSLLNSDFMNWLFKKIFNTHKILRGDLEALPIHASYFKEHPLFDENMYLSFLNIEKKNNGTYGIKR